MRVTDLTYFDTYKKQLQTDLVVLFHQLEKLDARLDLGYLTQASAVFSSNIEGNSIDLNAFMNSMMAKENFKPQKELQEIKDLVEAYEFAQNNELNEANFLTSHQILSDSLLIQSKRGKYRNDRMGVFGSDGLVYLAIEPEFVPEKMNELFKDIYSLLCQELTLEQLFYHATLIHLKFVHIHPFNDGNGRSARLLEKWFLSQKMNSRAWKIQSEKYYKEHLTDYYNAINLGVNYYELDYSRSLPFLILLPNALSSQINPLSN